ncbi:MAG TPA: phosphotransferase [Thermodesulfobacteriota bacterium]|nr:phosphotransferase [Thermodesulfobacteriota bacterium]
MDPRPLVPLDAPDAGRLDARLAEIASPAFVDAVVRPLAGPAAADSGGTPACEVALVQNRGTGRATVRYRFADGTVVFGKLYSDELGLHSWRVLTTLWGAGFDGWAAEQVCRPLRYLLDRNLLLVAGAAGTPLMAAVEEGGTGLVEQVRQAARWLVRLHRTPVRIGPAESLWTSLRLFRVVRRLMKAAGAAPQERRRLVELVEALCARARRGLVPAPPVQTHGRYHYEHIFLDGPRVTVIDFDRSRPSDPAKDLAEFVSMLRLRTFKLAGSVAPADAPTRAFLASYAAALPGGVANLPLYWGAALLLNMCRYVKRHEPRDDTFARMMAFYAAEFEGVLAGRFEPDRPAPAAGAAAA